DVTSEAGITLRNQGSIAGSPAEGTPLGRREARLEQLVIPEASLKGPVLLAGESRALLPGRYGSLTLQTGAELIVGAGDYFFDGPVLIEPGARLTVEDDAGPVRLGALDSVVYRGAIGTPSGPHPDLALVGLGA